MMDPDDLQELEAACEAALAEVVSDWLEDTSDRTAHLMAKAAVAVLEAVMDNAEQQTEGA